MRPNELDYELVIRGIHGTSTRSSPNFLKLRDALKREALGVDKNPEDSFPMFSVADEFKACERIVDSINNTMAGHEYSTNSLMITETEHRLLHLKGRIKRIHGKSVEEEREVMKLCMDCNGLIGRISACRPSVGGRISLNVLESLQTSAPSIPPPRTSLHSNPFVTLIELEDLGSDQTPLPPYRQAEVNWADLGATGTNVPPETSSRIASPTDFTNRAQFPSVQSEFATSDDRMVRNGATRNQLNLEYRPSQGTMQRGGTGRNIQNETTTTPQFNSSARANQRGNNMNNEAANSSRVLVDDGTFEEFLVDGDQFRRASQASFMITANNSQVRPAQGERIQRECGPTESRFDYDHYRSRQDPQANGQQYNYERGQNFDNPQTDGHQSEHGRERTFAIPQPNGRRSEYGCEYNFANPQGFSDPRANGQQSENIREQRFSNHHSQQQFNGQQADYVRDRNFIDGQQRQVQADRNYYGAHPNIPPPQPQHENYGQNDRRFGGANVFDFQADRPRSGRKTVPVNHWRISFSGDGHGMHLYDFLSQVRMLQRSEMIPDHELLPSMVHLFTGRAKNWYGRWSYTLRTVEEMVDALRQEFLPENYDYILMEKIANRKQKPNEPVGEFLAMMESLFMWLDVPLTEQHKVFMVKSNMLPKYAQGVAAFPIQSLAMLGRVCRRIESSSSSVSIGLPFESQNYAPNRYTPRSRSINEIEEDVTRLDLHCENEVCAFKRGQKPQSNRAESTGGTPTCYNCKKQGHLFRDCKERRDGVFCFGCGVRNETTRSCTKCSGAGNANRDLQKSEDQQRSANMQQAVQPSARPANPTA